MLVTGVLQSDDAAVWTVQSTRVGCQVAVPDEALRPAAQRHHIRLLQPGRPRGHLALRHAQLQPAPLEQAQVCSLSVRVWWYLWNILKTQNH